MIERHDDVAAGGTELLLLPNQSLSWASNKAFLQIISVLVLTIAAVFAVDGHWFVLPFAVLELLLLWGALYFTLQRLQDRELITVTDAEIIVQRGRRRVEQEVHLPRHWARLVVRRDRYRKRRLYLRSHGREVELALSLNCDDRKQLVAELGRLLSRDRVVDTRGPALLQASSPK